MESKITHLEAFQHVKMIIHFPSHPILWWERYFWVSPLWFEIVPEKPVGLGEGIWEP